MADGNSRSPWLDRLLDGSIVFSFDRSGYERHARRFRSEDLAVDLTGKVCLVTGANSGLGEAATSALADRGAEVVMLCRDLDRGEAARQRIRAATGSGRLRLMQLEVAEERSVDRFLESLPDRRVDLLINNAGALFEERITNNQGLEATLATNLLGPMRLTEGLIPKLSQAPDPRVINVSSGGMYPVRLELDDPNWLNRDFDGVRAYAETKRALVVMTEIWAQRHADRGILFHSMHPGWADTPGVRYALPGFWQRMRNRLRTAEQGADTIVWLAVAPAERLGSGKFWFDRRSAPTHLLPWTRESAKDRQRLWDLCCQHAHLADRTSVQFGEDRFGGSPPGDQSPLDRALVAVVTANVETRT